MLHIIKASQDGVLKNLCSVALVVANKEAEGLTHAEALGVPTLCLSSNHKSREVFEQELLSILSQANIDYVVLAGFMRILSPNFIAAYPKRIINIHPADTSQHRGLHAYEWAFAQKLQETMITVHYVDSGVDTGQIIAQATVDLRDVRSVHELEERGLAVEHKFYSQTLAKVFSTDLGSN